MSRGFKIEVQKRRQFWGPPCRPGNYKRRVGKAQGPALRLAQSNARESQGSKECSKAEEATCQGAVHADLRSAKKSWWKSLYCLLAKTGLWSLRTANVSSVSKRQSARLKDTENKCELDVFKQFGTK